MPEEKKLFDPVDKLDARLNPARPENDPAAPNTINAEPAFQELLVSYQNAEWEKSNRLIDQLLEKYPGMPRLLDFKTDIEVQLMLGEQSKKEAKVRDRLKFRNFMRFVAVIAVLVLIGAFFAYQAAKTYERSVQQNKLQSEQVKEDRLETLISQASSLLDAGKSQEALDIINQIQAIDPDHAALPGLLEKASTNITLTSMYEEAMLEMEAGNNQAALEKFNQVKEIDPFYRDVDYQLDAINNRLLVTQYLADAEKAYQEHRWIDVVDAYEEAIDIDPSVDAPGIKDRMVNSYLRSIVETLSKEDETVEELSRSERYYRKAISLIPQDKEYIAERENLRQLSVELLITKYHQTAMEILKNTTHSVREVETAVGYLKKAVELGPENSPMLADLAKAELYLSGLQSFNGQKWDVAIQALEDLAKFSGDYPNGMARQLLFEAYSARGLRYYSGGFYMDARINFEAAEIIAWENSQNLLRLYQVQIDIGNTLGKLDNYRDAVSYYQYALNAINISQRAKNETTLLQDLNNASTLASQGKYLEAYQSYVEILPQIESLTTPIDVEVRSGDNLAFIAGINNSTIRAIRAENNLVDMVTISRGQFLKVPTLP